MAPIYEETVDAWRRELRNAELQPLRPGFFKDFASYVRRLREAQRNLDPKSLKAIIMDEEMNRLAQVVTQLVGRRLEKLWSEAQNFQTVNLDSSEKWVHQGLSDIVRHYQKFEEDLFQGREPSNTPNKQKGKLLLRFVKDVPSIIGVDLKTHGPFLKEDVATLPFENAESLIRQGVAVEIRTPVQDNG